MKVRVQLFSHLRDLAGVQQIDIDLADGAVASDLLDRLYHQFPALRSRDKTILVGAGVEFVDRNYKLKTGDEISVMPPVQGG
jgi:MoaD family protein